MYSVSINKFNLKSEMKFDDHKKKYFSKKKARPQKRVISGLAGGAETRLAHQRQFRSFAP